MFAKLKTLLERSWKRFCMSDEEKYLMDATDLVDLEYRMRRWREMQIERSRQLLSIHFRR